MCVCVFMCVYVCVCVCVCAYVCVSGIIVLCCQSACSQEEHVQSVREMMVN